MLLSLVLGNWMSYRDEAQLDLIGTLERQHKNTLTKLPTFRSKYALPVAAIYGGNASGKTGIFEALSTVKLMVTTDCGVSGVLPVEPFRLDTASPNSATSFDITFLAGPSIYRYYLEATEEQVLAESLDIVTEKGETCVFERDGVIGSLALGDGYFADEEHVEFTFKSTRKNQLFLQSAVAQNISELMQAYDWFASSLELVGVDSQAWSFATALGSRQGFIDFASTALSRLDTGISRLVSEPVGVDALPRDAALRKRAAVLSENEILTVLLESRGDEYGFEMLTVRSSSSGPDVQRLRTVHVGPDGKEHIFSLGMESSGTRRLMGLLPMLFDLSGEGGASKVYVVDELDRCLHTMLTKHLIQGILETCGPESRKQLLFTTHDLLLMDQSLLRRDEMFVVQRNPYGVSELIGLSEYKGIRNDKDLIRSYLDGRFGGIPMLSQVAAHV